MQDVGFVVVAVYCAQLGGRIVRSWQFGLRRPGAGWWPAARLIVLLLVAFVVLSVVWSELVHPGEEKTARTARLQRRRGAAGAERGPDVRGGADLRGVPVSRLHLHGAAQLAGDVPAAVMTGLLFGGVHVGSAPVLDLVPLAALGFGLCLLYRYTGSLYPCMVAHSLNNSIAFSSLEGWGWQAPVLMVGALAAIGALVLAFRRVGLIAPEPGARPAGRVGFSDARWPCPGPRSYDGSRAAAGGAVRAPMRAAAPAAAGTIACRRDGGARLDAVRGPRPAPAPRLRPARYGWCCRRSAAAPRSRWSGQRIAVRGIVTPYVGGQTVKVSFYRDGRKLAGRRP